MKPGTIDESVPAVALLKENTQFETELCPLSVIVPFQLLKFSQASKLSDAYSKDPFSLVNNLYYTFLAPQKEDLGFCVNVWEPQRLC